jgi:serine/threonine protein kinase
MKDKFLPGTVLDGRFETISPLNHGSFGMVFMAKDLTTDELVAIKCLTKRSATDSPTESAFAIDENSEELACHARLGSHPNIVNLIHSFDTESHVYLVLEFCSRGDLYEAIRTGCGPLETEHVRDFMLQLVDAIEHCHSKGMYHRDIKPENIFLTQSGAMKIGDFGLATTDAWSYETSVGSDRYMSPEQYDHGGTGYAPAQADIWAVGICLLNILFSRNPFTAPTASDPLFNDFTNDKQSLFDVFPTMSQDTFEVILQCMSLDPEKRSLSGVRDALERVISFTTFDESLDDFCTMPRPAAIASANREPLRTPSIQTPHVEQGSFPWAKALQASPPQHFRQLSAIPDTEDYSEDLFPASEASIKYDWFSGSAQTPSMASVLDSALGASMNSMAIRLPSKKSGPPRASVSPVSGSLPIAVGKPLPSLASVFGRKHEMVSKSWSDLWEEEEEEEEQHERELKERQAQNARTWSHESKSDDVALGGLSEPKGSSFVNIRSSNKHIDIITNDIDSDHVADGFFFQDTSMSNRQYSPPRYSPPSKRTTFDKWEALGNRRRACNGKSGSENTSSSYTHNTHHFGTPDHRKTGAGRRNMGLGFTGFGASGGIGGAWDMKVKEKETPRSWDKVRDHQQPRRPKTGDVGDLEWVGGWHDLHL